MSNEHLNVEQELASKQHEVDIANSKIDNYRTQRSKAETNYIDTDGNRKSRHQLVAGYLRNSATVLERDAALFDIADISNASERNFNDLQSQQQSKARKDLANYRNEAAAWLEQNSAPLESAQVKKSGIRTYLSEKFIENDAARYIKPLQTELLRDLATNKERVDQLTSEIYSDKLLPNETEQQIAEFQRAQTEYDNLRDQLKRTPQQLDVAKHQELNAQLANKRTELNNTPRGQRYAEVLNIYEDNKHAQIVQEAINNLDKRE